MHFPDPDSFPTDKRKVRDNFDRAAARYDQVAALQRAMGERLMAHLEPVRFAPRLIVDVGTGTGDCLRPLERRYREARVVGLDIAEGMLRQAKRKAPRFFHRQHFVCADVDRLPLPDHSVDLLFSNATLQWCHSLERTYQELARVLAPGGLLLFSTFGPDTLKELRESWSVADDYPHVNTFLDLHDIGDALLGAGFRDVVVDADWVTRTYRDVPSLMHDLKALGAHHVAGGRHQGLTGRGRIQAMLAAYEGYRREDGLLPATYEILYAHAWSPQRQSQAVFFGRG